MRLILRTSKYTSQEILLHFRIFFYRERLCATVVGIQRDKTNFEGFATFPSQKVKYVVRLNTNGFRKRIFFPYTYCFTIDSVVLSRRQKSSIDTVSPLASNRTGPVDLDSCCIACRVVGGRRRRHADASRFSPVASLAAFTGNRRRSRLPDETFSSRADFATAIKPAAIHSRPGAQKLIRGPFHFDAESSLRPNTSWNRNNQVLRGRAVLIRNRDSVRSRPRESLQQYLVLA